MGFGVEKACNLRALGVAGSSLVRFFRNGLEKPPNFLAPDAVGNDEQGLLNSEGGYLKNE